MITNYIVEENILQAFRRAEKLKCHIRNCFKINGKLNLIVKLIQKKTVNILDSKIMREK